MSEHEGITTIAGRLQQYAEQFARKNPERATLLHRIAREVAREVEAAQRVYDRAYHCMFCEPSRTRGEAPAENCKTPYDHAREDGTRYVEPPQTTLLNAALLFGDELARVLAAVAQPRYRAALSTLAATGLRIEELRRLRPCDLRGEYVHVEPEEGAADTAEPTKGYRARSIPLARVAVEVVAGYLAIARQSGAGYPGRPPSERRLLTVLHAACDATGVPRCGLHDLRRAFATEAFRAGVPLTVIASWLGHADVRTTEGYIVAYRSDRQHTAPVPRALGGGAEKRTKDGRLRRLSIL